MINTDKINVPDGVQAEVKRRLKVSHQSIGATFKTYEHTKIGVGKEKQALIMKTAVEVAKEKRRLLDFFIDAVESANIDPSVSAVK
jgi:hypothetical protein